MRKANGHLINLKAEKALKKAVLNAIKDHARTDDPIVVWKNGKVVRISAKKYLIREKQTRYGK